LLIADSKHTVGSIEQAWSFIVDESPQHKGGKARAAVLSSEERAEIARRAAETRWHPDPTLAKAVYSGEDKIADWSVHLYVLDNDERVISERGFIALIGAKGRGKTGGHRLASIIKDPIIKSFFSNDVLVAIEHPIRFVTETNSLGFGYSAKILKDFCVGFSKAKSARALKGEIQERYAQYCEGLLYAFAEMGVIGWVDSVTGFKQEKTRDALHRILDRYVSAHWARWSKTFPDEFYEQIYRLRDLPYDPENVARPGFIGTLTSNIVYARLAPGVLEELQRKNPVLPQTKRRRRKHFQWLTTDFGHPKLGEHISNVIFLMRSYDTWDSFYRRLQRTAPRLNETAEFDFGDDDR
jgi:hypothetical protein